MDRLLVYECVHSYRTQGWLVLESASVSYGKATPYFPVLDLLKRYCHIEERDDSRTIRAKVTGQVLTLDVALQDTVPALLALLDALPDDDPFLRLDPPQRRQRTLEALTRVLLRESQVQPLLLVFEDLHWIDTETQALLDRLVESLPTARFLLLVNYRPEYQHGWASKTYYAQLRLDPLPPASAEALLAALLGNDPSMQPLTRLLIARTEGNPFFLEESVRGLLETEVLVGTPGAYRLAQALPTIQVPATVQAVLAARIDRLPADAKHLLQTAAVIGHEVPLILLQAIADLAEETLHRSLAQLQATEFLYETRLFPEREYTFKHALTHEVVYGSLLQERRRALHARIVEALETLTAERLAEQVDRLAHHAVRGAVWDKALTYSQQAGARAMARSAYREAAECFEQALAALAQLPERRDTVEQAIDLRFDLRSALAPLNEHTRVFDHLHAAEALAERLDDPQRLGRLASYLCFSFSVIGAHDRAMASGQRALALATTSGAFDVQVIAQNCLGIAYYAAGDYAQGLDCMRQGIALLPGELGSARFGLPILPAATSRGYVAWGLAELGDFVEAAGMREDAVRLAEAYFRQALALAQELGMRPLLAHCHRGLGTLYLTLGQREQARAALSTAIALYSAMGMTFWFPQAEAMLAQVSALA